MGILQDVWNSLVSHWDSTKAKEIAEQARKNRMSEVEPGAGPSKSFGGRLSFIELAARMVRFFFSLLLSLLLCTVTY